MNRVETLTRERSRLRQTLLISSTPLWARCLHWSARAVVLLLAIALLGSSGVPAGMTIWRSIDTISNSWDWDFATWEIDNIQQKLRTQWSQPLAAVSPAEQASLVRAYMLRAGEIGALEWQIEQLYAQPDAEAQGAPAAGGGAVGRRQLEAQLAVLVERQESVRPAVEQAIERQVAAVLTEEKIGAVRAAFPPVWFTFTEPPRKLVASPRATIEAAYYAMLQPDLPADGRESIETAILETYNLSAYVTQIGGLGAFPAIVSDKASLQWVLSTVAHEWVHNYLTLFPLGINYGATNELTILNETVADIAGDELGAAVLADSYAELVRPFPGKDQPAPSRAEAAAPPFDFAEEMRHTREVADLFLSVGRVQDAEEYMQIRRLLFVENGYPIRKINQAYFAFHGAYGTGAAATSPIGPKLQHLRSLTPDLRTFLDTVRWFTSESDLDNAIASWSAQ